MSTAKCTGRGVWGAVPGRTDGSGAQRCICEHVPVCGGERAGTAGTRALKSWERTEEGGEDKASGDAGVHADLCGGVSVDQSTSGCSGGAGSLWPGSGFHAVGASLYPANPGVRWGPGDRVLPHLWDSPLAILAVCIGRVCWLLGVMLGSWIILLSPLRPCGL